MKAKQDEPFEMFDHDSCEIVAEFFAVYANPTRMRIFCALREGRMTVSELAEHAQVSRQNISQHLRIMRDKGAVHREKEAQHIYYSIANPRFISGVMMIHEALIDELQRRMGSMHAARQRHAARGRQAKSKKT